VSDPITVAGQNQYDIRGGARPSGGTNLFHSFGNFNVPVNTIANFSNDSGLTTSNILARVTGGNPSSIFGIIQTTGFENANLFLMNPAGIVFGPNASLNVGGSVAFTTADYLRLGENGRFNANLNATSDALLSTAPVTAFGFLGSNPGAILVQGSQFSVANGKDITLMGGNITIESGTLANGTVETAILSAQNGKIQLASTASSGEFDVTLEPFPNVDGASFTSFGSVNTIAIRGGQFALVVKEAALSSSEGSDLLETISLSPMSSIISSNAGADSGAGVQIRTQALQMNGVSIRSTSLIGGRSGTVNISASDKASFINSTIDTRSFPPTNSLFINGNGGTVTIAAPIISVDGSFITTSAIGDGITPTTASGGSVTLNGTTSIFLQQSDIITESFDTKGNSGAVTITAPTVTVSGVRTQGIITSIHASSENPVAGNGGDIRISGTNVTLTDSARFESVADSEGTFSRGGSILIGGDQGILIDEGTSFKTSTLSRESAGNIQLESQHVTIKGQSALASDTFGLGGGGTIKITGTENVSLESGSLISTTANSSSQGLAGSIEFNSPKVTIVGGGAARSESLGAGHGGIVTVQDKNSPAQSVLISGPDSGIFTNAQGIGLAGDIVVKAKSVTLQNGGTISASTTGIDPLATGGSIIVHATDQVTLTNRASITASSTKPDDPSAGGKAKAGDISIDAGQRFDMQDSNVTTEATQASGGNIKIKAVDLIRVANSNISSSVQGGPSTAGGNITIDPKTVVLQNAQILANANQGNGGNITITTPTFLADQFSLVDASSQFGLNGRVTIQSPTSNLSGTVAQLASKPTATPALLQNRCVALAGGGQSSFIVAGRDTLPSEPGGWLSSPLVMENGTNDEREDVTRLIVRNMRLGQPMTSAAPVTQTGVLSLRRLTPPGFLVRTFANPSTGCTS
jgi:filamentous hemagglutinin family protein